MKCKASMMAFGVGLMAASAPAQIAITEFLNNPDGADTGREWVELFNFSRGSISLLDWTLGDEDTDSVTLPEITVPSGGYVMLVSGGIGGVDAATAKAVFETEWLGGIPHPAVIGMEGTALANGADELILADAGGNIVWGLAYGDDGTPPHATFLTETNDYSISRFGSKAAPGVVRHGDDNGLSGFLGYEENDATPDPLAYESDVSQLAACFGEEFGSVEEASVGSPLLGSYRVLPVGDVDGDGAVGVIDLLLLLAAVGPCPEPCPPPCAADIDGDCTVAVYDLVILLINWG